MTDPWGNNCIVLQRRDFRAELIVAIPSPPGEPTEVSIYAESGQPDFPTIEPSLGAVLVIVVVRRRPVFAHRRADAGRARTSAHHHRHQRAQA